MRRVILESPYAGDVTRNTAYARAAMAHAIQEGDAPIASHLLYTQPGILADLKPDERALGINCGYAWGDTAEAVVVYEDLGVSPGMKAALARYRDSGKPIEYRTIPGWRWQAAALEEVMSGITAAEELANRLCRASDGEYASFALMLVGVLEMAKYESVRLMGSKT